MRARLAIRSPSCLRGLGPADGHGRKISFPKQECFSWERRPAAMGCRGDLSGCGDAPGRRGGTPLPQGRCATFTGSLDRATPRPGIVIKTLVANFSLSLKLKPAGAPRRLP